MLRHKRYRYRNTWRMRNSDPMSKNFSELRWASSVCIDHLYFSKSCTILSKNYQSNHFTMHNFKSINWNMNIDESGLNVLWNIYN